jgi:hypothetical protein
VTKTEVYTILRDVCIVSNRLTYVSEMEILAQPLCETGFTPTTFHNPKRLPIRISKPSHEKFHFNNVKNKTNKLPNTYQRSAIQLFRIFRSKKALKSRPYVDGNRSISGCIYPLRFKFRNFCRTRPNRQQRCMFILRY